MYIILTSTFNSCNFDTREISERRSSLQTGMIKKEIFGSQTAPDPLSKF